MIAAGIDPRHLFEDKASGAGGLSMIKSRASLIFAWALLAPAILYVLAIGLASRPAWDISTQVTPSWSGNSTASGAPCRTFCR